MTADPVAAQPIERKALYRVNEVIEILSLSRSTVYELIRSGRLRTVKEGGTRLVPAGAIADYVALLESEATAGVR
ncbi:helix-turn-helix domain-containing protein [Actinoallomurus sp. NBC_01490]|uniref:helix-turn-helix domain-containing protein n=1 Tax=Actinoallomurus sp. NBC_01490 TaxID=2903557 RepID=UPI002E364DD3|nr:helix-turn-helix domain-containing protein [Actinoallomurus sp. NBC_01490]